jgi:predicted Fe-Mo cluster-binding NifX family protein
MRIAIPYWLGRVSPVFDVADSLMLIDLEGGREIRRERQTLSGSDLFERAHQIRGCGVEVLICGAVSRTLESAMTGMGIEVVGFICGDIETVLTAYKEGRLDSDRFLMPGMGKRRRALRSVVGRRDESRPQNGTGKE